MQRSRWDLRPLSEEQLDYAALDTAHLTDLYRKLDAELHEKGLEKEAKRLFVGMTAVVWRPRVLDRSAHRNIARYAQLTSVQKERLRLLYRWRFGKAEEINRACLCSSPIHSSSVWRGWRTHPFRRSPAPASSPPRVQTASARKS